jgi:L-threonylcarbamoyladenylate synthase
VSRITLRSPSTKDTKNSSSCFFVVDGLPIEFQGRSVIEAKLTETKYLDANRPGAIEEAAALLRQGALVSFPTDTVYGLGVEAFDPAAIARLYEVKGRPTGKGIPVLMADLADLSRVARAIPETAWSLIQRFWPGSLTIILPRQPAMPAVLAPDETVAVRIPDHPVALALIRAAGGAVATTSANLSGQPAALTADEAWSALNGRIAAVLDGGPSTGALASTIVDCTSSRPQIVRVGPLSAAELWGC